MKKVSDEAFVSAYNDMRMGLRAVAHKLVTLMQLGAYKKVDHYAIERGFRVNTPHDAALVVHDPTTGETTPFACIERGIEFLGFLRRKVA